LRWSDPSRTSAMNCSIAASSMFSGSIPLALAKRARRDRPMCTRFSESIASSFNQAGLNGALGSRWTGLRPLAFTAARKQERMLAKLFGVRPAASGLTGASLALIAVRSRGMRDGSSRSNDATRLTPERKSRRRLAMRSARSSSVASKHASVASPEAGLWGRVDFGWRSLVMAFCKCRDAGVWTGAASGAQRVTGVAIREFYHKANRMSA
jgi:hypothetical protein